MVGKKQHITGYDANRQDTKCWGTCLDCDARGPVLNGPSTDPKNIREMDKWGDWHQRQEQT